MFAHPSQVPQRIWIQRFQCNKKKHSKRSVKKCQLQNSFSVFSLCMFFVSSFFLFFCAQKCLSLIYVILYGWHYSACLTIIQRDKMHFKLCAHIFHSLFHFSVCILIYFACKIVCICLQDIISGLFRIDTKITTYEQYFLLVLIHTMEDSYNNNKHKKRFKRKQKTFWWTKQIVFLASLFYVHVTIFVLWLCLSLSPFFLARFPTRIFVYLIYYG